MLEPQPQLFFSANYFVNNVVCVVSASFGGPPQWGAADAEIKVPSGENTELKRSPFKGWSRSA